MRGEVTVCRAGICSASTARDPGPQRGRQGDRGACGTRFRRSSPSRVDLDRRPHRDGREGDRGGLWDSFPPRRDFPRRVDGAQPRRVQPRLPPRGPTSPRGHPPARRSALVHEFTRGGHVPLEQPGPSVLVWRRRRRVCVEGGNDAPLSESCRAEATAPAETAAFRSPIPTQIVSNGEYNPLPQTREQQRVEARHQGAGRASSARDTA